MNTVVANGLNLHYYRYGRPGKPVIVLLHGLTDDGACWPRLVEALEADYDLVAPDARGHGLSDAPEHGYTPNDHAADMAAFIGALGLPPVTLIGHSMGGAVATAVAATYPELARAVVAEDPAWFDAGRRRSARARAADARGWRKDLLAKQALTAEQVIAVERPRHPSWDESEWAPWAASKHRVRPQVFEWILEPPMPWRDMLARIACPVLLVAGDPALDVIVSPEMAAEAQALAASLHVAQIPGAGHSIRREQFAPYLDAIRSFLAGVYAGA